MTIANGVNKNVNQFMTDFSEYIECIFDTVGIYLTQLEKAKLGSGYVSEQFECPVTEMIEASIDEADMFTRLDQKKFSDSVIYTEVYTDLSVKSERKREYIFKFICNGATISVKTRYVIYYTVQMYFGIKHPTSDKSIIPQDTVRFSMYSTMNTKFEDCMFQIENLIWTALMLKDIEVLSDLLMFVPESGKLLTEVVTTMLNMSGDIMIPIKLRVHETIEGIRNRFGMKYQLNKCIRGYDTDEDDEE